MLADIERQNIAQSFAKFQILDAPPPTPIVYHHAGAAFFMDYVGTRLSAAEMKSF